jgi:hypothetical protein
MQFNPGDIIHVQVTKADLKQDAGLKIEQRGKKYYIRKIGGLFKRRNTPLEEGDKIITLNEKDAHEYKDLNEMKKVIKDQLRITLVVERQDGDEEDDSDDDVEQKEVKETGLVVYPSDDEIEDEHGVDVQFAQDSGALASHDEASTKAIKKIEPGALMTLTNIEANPDLNGQYVKVLKKDPEKKGRWLVTLDTTGKTISVAGKKLKSLQG